MLIGSIPLMFAWGFYKHRVGAYNAYIILTITQLPRSLGDFAHSPVASTIGLAIGLGILGYVWFVRHKLFPDFAFVTPRKVKGQYAFES